MASAKQIYHYTKCKMGGPSNTEGVVGQLSTRIQQRRAKCGIKPDPANTGAYMNWNLCMKCADPVFSTNMQNQAQCKHIGMSEDMRNLSPCPYPVRAMPSDGPWKWNTYDCVWARP